MNHKRKTTIFIILLALLAIAVFLPSLVYAEVNVADAVDTTVKVSVCGNEIAESGEDCETQDLRSRTCAGLGYLDGTLACDISCSFDTSLCTLPSISPSNVAQDFDLRITVPTDSDTQQKTITITVQATQ